MRPGQQNNKRMRGRGRKGPNPLSRSYESNGPDVKIRGNAQHIAERYATLARDATSSGDRVMAENYLQHAEHYNRIVAAAQGTFQPAQNERDYDGDEDEGDEDGVEIQGRSDQRNGQYDQRNGQYRERGDGHRDNRGEGRGDGHRDRERPNFNNRERRDQAPGAGSQPFAREGGEEGGASPARSREDRPARRERRFEERGPRHRAEPQGGYEDESGEAERPAPAPVAHSADESRPAGAPQVVETSDAAADAPRRRGRPRRQPLAEEANAEIPSAPGDSPASVSADSPVQPTAEDAAAAPKRRGRPPRAAKTEEPTPTDAETAEPAAAKRKPGRPRKKKAEDEDGEESAMPAFLLASNG